MHYPEEVSYDFALTSLTMQKQFRFRANMSDSYIFDKIDEGMKTFPWNFPEKYSLPEFLPSPANFVDGDADGTVKFEPVSEPKQQEYQDNHLHFSPTMESPESLPPMPTEDPTEDFSELVEPLTPMDPMARFPPIEQQEYINLSPPQVTSPSTNEFHGECNFRMVLETQPKKVANPDWIYSVGQKKLYIKSKTPCPVRFLTTGPPPHGAFIRAMPVFRQPEHAKDVVRCCRNHTEEYSGSPATGHFLRCDNQDAVYDECPLTTRHSVRIPLRAPPSAEDSEELGVHELFYFICNNSCGGLNRRPIQIIFTLENLSGNAVLGRCYVNVRVCACPGRDSKQEIEAINRPKRKRPSKSGDHGLPAGFGPHDLQCFGSKMTKEDSTVYNLKICGFNNYLMLKRIAIALELFANMENKFTAIEPQDLEMPDFTEYTTQDQDASEPDSTIMKSLTCDSPPSLGGQEPYSVPTPQGESWHPAIPQDQAGEGPPSAEYPPQCFTYRRITHHFEFFAVAQM
ncbi:cellular tumor antigen p53-like [Montipora foliosa]|uniref:cellular tumor antigen p53-like n=1 Tax=Montipora foliosa TaxID=591990 RepID=UPI0035F1C320